jgi:HlyD family secretion protein
MLPGYSADIEVIIDQQRDVLRIPTQAVSEGRRVFVVDEDGRLEDRAIEIGLSNWAWTEVSAGLSPGEELVTSIDRAGLEAGVPVRVTTRRDRDD